MNGVHLHVLAHHGNHQIEKTNSLNESETENSVGEELTTHAWVAGDGQEESSENHTDTDTSTTETDGSGTHTQVLGDLDHGGGDFRGESTLGLLGEAVAGDVGEDLGSLLTLHGGEWGGLDLTGDAWKESRLAGGSIDGLKMPQWIADRIGDVADAG